MVTKPCSKCAKIKTLLEFSRDRGTLTGRQSRCKTCAEQNRRKRMRTRRAMIQKIKMEAGCAECGYKEHPAALHFHHTDPEEKEFSISSGLILKWSKVEAELEKCEVLCANCHARHVWDYKYYADKGS